MRLARHPERPFVLRAIRLTVVWLCLLVQVTQGQWEEHGSDVIETMSSGRVNWTSGDVSGQAQAEVGEQKGSIAVGRTAAFSAAAQASRQRLLATLMRVPVDATRTVEDVLHGSAEKRRMLETLVSAADVVQTRYLQGDRVETTLEISMFGDFTALLWPVPEMPSVMVSGPSDAVYTGIIIDARGLAIRQALFPRIVDEDDRVIYAPSRVNFDIARQRGYVAYVKTLGRAKASERIGTHPLIIRAQRVAGQARVDLLIRRADAMTLQRSAAIRALLERCQIVIVG